MLAFTQSPNLLLASKALPLWPALLEAGDRNKGKAPAGAPAPSVIQLPAECVVALLDLAGVTLIVNYLPAYLYSHLLVPVLYSCRLSVSRRYLILADVSGSS